MYKRQLPEKYREGKRPLFLIV